MSAKSVGRIYLRREKDIIHILSIKVDTKNGDIYFCMPLSDEQKKLGINNVKSSYHIDGQTHLTTQIPSLNEIDDGIKRKITKNMGFRGDKVYTVSEKNIPLTDIDSITRVGQGSSFKDINTLNHTMLKIVTFENIKWGSEVIDSRKYKNLSFNYFVIPKSILNRLSGHITDEYYSFPHPSLDLFIVIRIFDFWKDVDETNE